MFQAHAASAVLNFSENCTPDILTPYLDGIVSKLLVLLQVCNVPVHMFHRMYRNLSALLSVEGRFQIGETHTIA